MNDFTRSLFFFYDKFDPLFFWKVLQATLTKNIVLILSMRELEFDGQGSQATNTYIIRIALKSLLVSIVDLAQELHISITLRMCFKIRSSSSNISYFSKIDLVTW